MPKLVIQDRERTYLVDLRPGESVVLGRSSECDLPIIAPRASRRHCEIAARGEGHVVKDLGSTNGTLLNGAPFPEIQPLQDGDTIDAGGCQIVYRSQP